MGLRKLVYHHILQGTMAGAVWRHALVISLFSMTKPADYQKQQFWSNERSPLYYLLFGSDRGRWRKPKGFNIIKKVRPARFYVSALPECARR